jgi:apurinic endonuclease APN1
MKLNLNLGISISLPVNWDFIKPEYSNEPNNKKEFDNIKNELTFNKLNSLQIMFSKYNLSKLEITNIKKFIKKIKYKYVYIHASYQINIGTEPIILQNDLYNPSLDIFLTEIKNAISVGANGIIVHMGKNVKNQYEPDDVYNNMVNFVIQLFNKIKKNKILSKSKNFMILFETPAGQGGEMCSDINEIINFIQIFKPTDFYSNIGLCIDTCHIFQAGHNLNDLNEIKKIHQALNQIRDKIQVIHLNDSYHPIGSRLDRHEQIGKGHIITDNLIKFILPYVNIPLILETRPPYDNQIKLMTRK